ncbi:Late exocytosis, Golgi transport, partial [Rhizoctonia solani]
MARCWAVVPSPVQPKWPLMWIWQVLRTNDETFLRLSGVDATVYTRFLRACFYFAALHTCTTLLVILPIHYLLGYKDIKKSDINRGSVTTLIQGLPDEHADKILWVIWITFSWMLFLVWFVLGSLRYRAYAARHAPAPVMSRIGSPKKPASTATALHPDSAAVTSFPADSSTTGTLFPLQPEPAPALMMTNIPHNLRTPQMLRRYFGRYLPDGPAPESFDDDAKRRTKSWNKFKSAVRPVNACVGQTPQGPRKRVEELEEAHIHLAQTVMAAVATEMMTRRREEARKAKEGEIRRRERLRADAKSQQAHTSGSDGENGGGLLGAVRDRATRLRISVERFTLGRPDRSEVMDKLVHAIGPFVEESCRRDLQYGVMSWFSSTFGTVRAKPASSAFITFRRWEDARRAVRTLAHRPGRPLTCLIVMAPQSTDLDWERLVKGKFAAQYERFVRDWLVGAAIWLFQIFWLFPISFITTLISIQSLEVAILRCMPVDAHCSVVLFLRCWSLALVFFIPVILFVIGRKAQTEVTFSGLHDGILIRYYKWLILNIVYVSRLGLSSFRTFLEAFKKEIPDPFQLVSSSFPAAAPFYAGWCTYLHLLPPTVLISYPPVILQTSLQNLMQFGLALQLPLVTYIWGVRKASTPRKRKRGTRPRTIDYHYWTPNHLLGMHILMIFAVLNPLVIPFGLIYYSVANVVFRNQLLRVYARRFYEGLKKHCLLLFAVDAQIVF